MYKSEADFSRSLSTNMKKHGFDITRIESHGTSNGIPDMYVRGKQHDFWLELKNDPNSSICQDRFKIAWRPGQQGWHYLHYKLLEFKRSLTVQACTDGLIVIPMEKLYKGNIVNDNDLIRISKDQLRCINIGKFLMIVSNMAIIPFSVKASIISMSIYYPEELDIDVEAMAADYDSNFSYQQLLDVFFDLETLLINHVNI